MVYIYNKCSTIILLTTLQCIKNIYKYINWITIGGTKNRQGYISNFVINPLTV